MGAAGRAVPADEREDVSAVVAASCCCCAESVFGKAAVGSAIPQRIQLFGKVAGGGGAGSERVANQLARSVSQF